MLRVLDGLGHGDVPASTQTHRRTTDKSYVIHLRAYDQYRKTEPTYAQYCLFIYFLFPPHVSASNYAIIKGAI
jgi:hypothetical protein